MTSLGLVQMTRKRIGTGLLEAFSENCDACQGRGLILRDVPVEPKKSDDDSRRGGRRGKGRGRDDSRGGNGAPKTPPSPKDIAAMARPDIPEPMEPEPTEPESEQKAASEPSSEPAETPRSSAPREKPAEAVEAAEPEAAAESAEPPTAEPVETPESPKAEPVETPRTSAPQEPPEKPKVVTRTRRRSASRPAGPPPTAPSGDSGPESASRTVLAEAPVATGQVGAPADTGQVEPGTVDAEPGTTASVTTVEHVPIKKKGSRKR